jgi:hypothetical protein
MAKQVLKVHDLICASRPETIASKIIFEQRDIGWAPYGDHWRHMRKLSTLELLTLKRLEDSKNVRDEELSWLVHGIFKHCKVNVLFHNFSFFVFFFTAFQVLHEYDTKARETIQIDQHYN